jgi:predicted LPLAT superfamily acyltransferase
VVSPNTDFSKDAQSASSANAWTQQRERGNTLALKLITWIALHLGRRISRFVLLFVVAYFYLSAPQARRASRRYLSCIPNQSSSALAVYRHFYAFAAVTLDRLYFLNGRLDLFDIRIKDEGNQALNTAASGAGMFLMGAHMGSFESVRSIASTHPHLKMVLLMYEENALRIKQALSAINPKAQQAIISLGRPGAMLEVKEQLSQGGLVGVLADRSLDDQAQLRLPFLGRQANFPSGPFRMAAMLRHPVFFMTGIYKGGNRYTIYLEPVMDFTNAKQNRELQIQEALSRYVSRIEAHCLSAPYNWFNFFDFWQDTVKPQ